MSTLGSTTPVAPISTPGATAAGPVVNASDLISNTEQHWNVSGTSILVAWIITDVGSALIVLLYSWRRPQDAMIYLPRIQACKLKHREATEDGVFIPPVPDIDSGFLGWLKPAIRDILVEIRFWRWRKSEVSQRDIRLLHLLGLDAVSFLQFLRLLRWLFTAISICTSLPLLAANYRMNTAADIDPSDVGALNGTALDLKVFTAANVKGNDILVHIGFQLIIFLIAAVFLCLHAYQHNELVKQWYSMNLNEIAFKTIMVTNLSITHEIKLSDKAKRAYFRIGGGKTTENKTVLRAKKDVCAAIKDCPAYPHGVKVSLTHKNMTHIADLVEEYESKWFSRFDKVLTAWLREAEMGDRKYYDTLWDRFTGDEVTVQGAINDAIEKKREIEKAQFVARDDVDRETYNRIDSTITSAFITVSGAKEAEKIIQACKASGNSVAAIGVERAPRPQNIVWRNLQLDPKARSGRALSGKVALAFICFFNTVPLLAITFLANLDSAIGSFPWLRGLVESSTIWKGVFTVLAGILPPTIAALFGYLLPILMRMIGSWSGALTRGQLDKDVIKQLFMFLLLSNFFLFSLLGVIWETYLSIRSKIGVEPWDEIFGELTTTLPKIAMAYISNSSYWLSWYPVKALTACVALLQIPRILMKFFQAYIFARTATDVHKLSQPEDFEYAIEYSNIIFAAVVGLVYAPLAPLVPVAATILFWVKSTIVKNQLTYVENSPETDGKVWTVVVNRLLVALTMMHLMMVLIVGIKTQSCPLPVAASFPLLLTAALAYFLRQINKTPSSLLLPNKDPGKERGDGEGGEEEIPQFQHALLKDDWAPQFHWMPEDAARLELARKRFKGLDELLGRKRKEEIKKKREKGEERIGKEGDRERSRRRERRRKDDRWGRI